jgi:hypothetical protein
MGRPLWTRNGSNVGKAESRRDAPANGDAESDAAALAPLPVDESRRDAPAQEVAESDAAALAPLPVAANSPVCESRRTDAAGSTA